MAIQIGNFEELHVSEARRLHPFHGVDTRTEQNSPEGYFGSVPHKTDLQSGGAPFVFAVASLSGI